MSPSDAVTFITDAYIPQALSPLDMTGDSMCDLQALWNIW